MTTSGQNSETKSLNSEREFSPKWNLKHFTGKNLVEISIFLCWIPMCEPSMKEQFPILKTHGTTCVNNSVPKLSMNLMKFLKGKLSNWGFLVRLMKWTKPLRLPNKIAFNSLRKIRLGKIVQNTTPNFKEKWEKEQNKSGLKTPKKGRMLSKSMFNQWLLQSKRKFKENNTDH